MSLNDSENLALLIQNRFNLYATCLDMDYQMLNDIAFQIAGLFDVANEEAYPMLISHLKGSCGSGDTAYRLTRVIEVLVDEGYETDHPDLINCIKEVGAKHNYRPLQQATKQFLKSCVISDAYIDI
jgi:hypothetical protein